MTIKQLLAKFALLSLCVLFTQIVFSQTKTVSGKVLDDKGNPIQGATVSVKGSKIGTSTDATGSFSLNVAASAKTLVISSVGFTQQEVGISDGPISVAMAASSQSLTDVVVIGYGTARKKDLTGSVASVTAKDFNTGVITSPDQLLQGKVAGLEITNNSGQPGSATTVIIRGNNSIRAGNNPLYVIDGVELDGRNATPNPGIAAFGTTPDVNPLLYVNPNDIARIDVLKDASASAIYGSRGSNGVIVITTKKSTSGAPKLELNTSFGLFAGFMKKFDVLSASEYRAAIKKYGLSSSLDHGATVNPLKDITQNNLTQNYSLGLSGGNENGKYRASFLASTTQGFLKGTNLDKYIGTFTGSYKFLDKKLSIDFGLIAAHTMDNKGLVSNDAGSTGNLVSSALEWNPTQAYDSTSGNFYWPSNGSGNPLGLEAAFSDVAQVNTYLGNISAAYKILDNLEYKFLYAINQSNGQRLTNIDGWIVGYPNVSGVGFGGVSSAALTSQTFTHTLNYHTSLSKDLNLEALAGYEYFKTNYSNRSNTATGFNTNLQQQNTFGIPYTSIMQDGNAQGIPSVYVDPTIELQSYFARVNLNFLDRYYLTGTFRADGSNKFGANNKYGYFPSGAFKWAINNEEFMKDSRLFSNLALRLTYGVTGNQEFPSGSALEQYAFSAYNTASQINVKNVNLKWEQTATFDAGIDFGFSNNRVYGSVDFYSRNTTNILTETAPIQPAPPANEWLNIPGNLKNTGVEVFLGATIVNNKDFSWDVTGNFSYNHNILKNFYVPGTKIPQQIITGGISGQGVSGATAQIITNDKTIDEFYLKPFQGFDQNGNQQYGANPVFCGNPNPTVLWGVSTTIRYKKLSLDINGGGADGFLIYNNTATNITNIAGIAQGRNIDKKAYNSQEKPTSGVAANSRFLESGNYFKLRNLRFNYNIGNVAQYVKGVNIFVGVSNLFVLTKFSGFDPEVNIDKSQGGFPSRSIEYIPYPTPRTITFGLSLSL
ncbi:MAG: SusC/RagA family TonB-linked outer membrane protein [Bacteroidetes bacterium]|nr:SusC/RagA family TonB-linked outer membrane protein [Bacteroidota bacterium]